MDRQLSAAALAVCCMPFRSARHVLALLKQVYVTAPTEHTSAFSKAREGRASSWQRDCPRLKLRGCEGRSHTRRRRRLVEGGALPGLAAGGTNESLHLCWWQLLPVRCAGGSADSVRVKGARWSAAGCAPTKTRHPRQLGSRVLAGKKRRLPDCTKRSTAVCAEQLARATRLAGVGAIARLEWRRTE